MNSIKKTTIRNVNQQHKEQLSKLDNLALWITNHVGTMRFFFIIFCWTVLWLGWNSLAPARLKFDPYPAFVLWLFISNMVQIFLMPLIMIGQNLQSKHAELRAEEDFNINKKTELEVEEMLNRLDSQEQKIDLLIQHIKELKQQKNE